MSKHFFQNELARKFLKKIYRIYAYSFIFSNKKKIFINSIPKAGTHLALGIIEEVPGYMNSGIYIDMWELDKNNSKFQKMSKFKLDIFKLRKILSKVRNGQIITAHLPWDKRIVKEFHNHNFVIFNLSRKKSKIIDSNLYYIKNLKRHFLHNIIINEFKDDKERKFALKNGLKSKNKKIYFDGFNYLIKNFNNWKKSKNIIQLNFEELVSTSYGGNLRKLKKIYKKILFHLDVEQSDQHINDLINKTTNKKSFTFNKGRP